MKMDMCIHVNIYIYIHSKKMIVEIFMEGVSFGCGPGYRMTHVCFDWMARVCARFVCQVARALSVSGCMCCDSAALLAFCFESALPCCVRSLPGTVTLVGLVAP